MANLPLIVMIINSYPLLIVEKSFPVVNAFNSKYSRSSAIYIRDVKSKMYESGVFLGTIIDVRNGKIEENKVY
jgi:hypothetical protein